MKRIAVAVVGALLAAGLAGGVGFGASTTPAVHAPSRNGCSSSTNVNRTVTINGKTTVTHTTETHTSKHGPCPTPHVPKTNTNSSAACLAAIHHQQDVGAALSAAQLKDPTSKRVTALQRQFAAAGVRVAKACS